MDNKIDIKFLQESVDIRTNRLQNIDLNNGHVKLGGVFLQADVVNGNGRMYESSWFNPYIQNEIVPRVNNGASLGELDHPDYFPVLAKHATHKIIELKQIGSNWHGVLELLKNECSKDYYQILACINQKVAIGVSSRAVGQTKYRNGIEYVDRDGFNMSTPADIVLDPSAPDAYITAILENNEALYQFASESGIKFLDESKKLINTSKSEGQAIDKISNLERYILKTAFNKYYK